MQFSACDQKSYRPPRFRPRTPREQKLLDMTSCTLGSTEKVILFPRAYEYS
jgi:hypothetical protein